MVVSCLAPSQFSTMKTCACIVGCRGVNKDSFGNIVMGDVIVAVGGEPIPGTEDLVAAIERFNIGDQVPLTVRRGDSEMKVVVPLLGPVASA